MPTQRVLVVDDIEPLRELAAELLQDAGYEVLTASDGETGLDLIAREQPDLVLLDLGLPRLDGRGVIERLSQMPAPPPVVIMTGSRAPDFELPAFVRGTVQKPVTSAQLVATVARALARRA